MSAKIIVADAEGQHWGPYEQEHIRQYLEAGNFTPMHWAMREGDSDWSPLGELVEPAVEEAPAPTPQPVAQPQVAAEPEPEPEQAPSGTKAPREVMSGVRTIQMPGAGAKATPSKVTASPQVAAKAAPPQEPAAQPNPAQGAAAAQPGERVYATPAQAQGSPTTTPQKTVNPALKTNSTWNAPLADQPRAGSPSPTGTPVKSPAPREMPAATTPTGGVKDPIALPVLVLGALLAIGGCTLLYMDIDYLWYAAGMTIAAVLASLYGMLRGQLVPGLSLLVVTVIGAGVVGYLSINEQEQKIEMRREVEKIELREAEEKSAQEFIEQTNNEAAEQRKAIGDAVTALQAEQNDANWQALESAMGPYTQSLQVSGEAANSNRMKALDAMRTAIMDRDMDALNEAYAKLP